MAGAMQMTGFPEKVPLTITSSLSTTEEVLPVWSCTWWDCEDASEAFDKIKEKPVYMKQLISCACSSAPELSQVSPQGPQGLPQQPE